MVGPEKDTQKPAQKKKKKRQTLDRSCAVEGRRKIRGGPEKEKADEEGGGSQLQPCRRPIVRLLTGQKAKEERREDCGRTFNSRTLERYVVDPIAYTARALYVAHGVAGVWRTYSPR